MKVGLIYEIVCNETNDRYIGSTFETTIARRITTHRSKMICACKDIINRNNFKYGLLEKVEVETRDELRMKEREWYDKLLNININKPYISHDEEKQVMRQHYQDNKEHLLEYAKKYRDDNRTKINEFAKQKYYDKIETLSKTIICECGSSFRYDNRHHHFKTKKHLNFKSNSI